MIKIAIPVTNGKLNMHFGHTQQFFVYNVENDIITKEERFDPPVHQPGVYPSWLANMGVTNVIAGGMGQQAISIFTQNKINVFVGVTVKEPKELVQDFIEGVLDTRDNSCDHDSSDHSCNH